MIEIVCLTIAAILLVLITIEYWLPPFMRIALWLFVKWRNHGNS